MYQITKNPGGPFPHIVSVEAAVHWRKWDEMVTFCYDSFGRGAFFAQAWHRINFRREGDALFFVMHFRDPNDE